MKKLRSIYLAVVSATLLLVLACNNNDDEPSALTSADREKFFGNWAGNYECGDPAADTLFIGIGLKDLDFKIVLHAQAFNADTLHGELTSFNTITIPDQTIAFFPGSGEITFSGNELSLVQRGLGITCRGNDYTRFE